MGEIQRKHERAISEASICWFNARDGKRFRYDSRPHEAPDQRYVDEDEILNIEITDAYYDKDDAAMQWNAARKEDDAPTHWMGEMSIGRSWQM